MANITIEYMILIPVLILLIFLLPYAANPVVNYWSTSSQKIALQDTDSHIVSSIQQVYLFLNGPTVTSGQVTNNIGIPQYIDNYAYIGNASLTSVSSTEKILNVTLSYLGNPISTSSVIAMGQNVQLNSTYASFESNSTTACISAYKDSSNNIWISLET